jgi:hypothetical protein
MDMHSSEADLLLQVKEAINKCVQNPATCTLLLLKSESVNYEQIRKIIHIPKLKSYFSYIFDDEFKEQLIEKNFTEIEDRHARLSKIDQCLALCFKIV